MSPAPLRLLRPAALGVSALVPLARCGSSDDAGTASGGSSGSASATASEVASPSASESASPRETTGTTIDIRIAGGEASPQGKAVQVAIGEPVTLRLDSDAPGELRVHSTPEQEIAFEPGSIEKVLTFDRPGVVDGNSHDLDQLQVRLEVR